MRFRVLAIIVPKVFEKGALLATIPEALAVAVQYQQAGHWQQAEAIYRQIVQAEPDHAESWCYLGILCLGTGRFGEAVDYCRRALALTPNFGLAQDTLSQALQQQDRALRSTLPSPQPLSPVARERGLVAQAGSLCYPFSPVAGKRGRGEGVSSLDIAEALACNQQAVTLAQQRRFQEAEAGFRQALRLNPHLAEAHNNLGNVLKDQGQLAAALEEYQEAIRLRPDYAEAHHNLGVALTDQGQLAAALEQYQEAVRLKPDYAKAYYNMGNVLKEQGQVQTAVAQYQEAVRLRPDYAEAHNNLGGALRVQGRLAEAAAHYQEALRLKPGYADAHNNLGVAFMEQGQLTAAATEYQEAIRLRPDFPNAHSNRALVWLLTGDFERGWPEFEWRWQTKTMRGSRPSFVQPLWDGSSLTGKTILLQAEQGLGDTIQFIRYAALVKNRGGYVIVECQPALVALLQSCPGADRVVAQGSQLLPFDVQVPLMSLPRILGTTPSTIPAAVPYLTADAGLVEHWRQELEWGVGSGEWGVGSSTKRIATAPALRTPIPPPLAPRLTPLSTPHSPLPTPHSPLPTPHSPLPTPHSPLFKIGIVWQCKNFFPEDYRRSAPLAAFAPLAALPGVHLFSLQKDVDSAVIASAPFAVTDLGELIKDFADTAAALKNLDLLVTIDTAVAHCAGALGVPVWVALQFASDWRWLLKREDSPWYPTVRLFRQKQPGDWDEVFQRITEEVRRIKG